MFMIDDGSTEKAALKDINANFVLCKFHLIRAWRRKLNECEGLEPEIYNKILGQLYKMIASQTKQQYEERLKDIS